MNTNAHNPDNLTDEQLRAEVDRLSSELQNIANAKPHEWGDDMRDQFQPWAQNRARHALASRPAPKPTPQSEAEVDPIAARDAYIAELRGAVQPFLRVVFVSPEDRKFAEAANRISALLARKPSDAGAELVRLRDRLAVESAGNASLVENVRQLVAATDALRAQLATAEAETARLRTDLARQIALGVGASELVQIENKELRGKLASAEARIKDEMAGSLELENSRDLLKMDCAAYREQLAITESRLRAATDAAERAWNFVIQLSNHVLPPEMSPWFAAWKTTKSDAIPPHPDSERLDDLLACLNARYVAGITKRYGWSPSNPLDRAAIDAARNGGNQE